MEYRDTRLRSRTQMMDVPNGMALVRWAIGAAVPFLAAMLIAAASMAEEPESVKRTEMVRVLNDRHAEAPIARGLSTNGNLVEVFTTKDGGTWTIVMTRPDGRSFLIGAGEYWANLPERVGGPQL